MYKIYPNLCDFVSYRETFIRAMKARRGLHKTPDFEWPFEFRQRIAGAPATRFVGDFSTGYCWYPPEYPRVAPQDRIFFNSAAEAMNAGFLLLRNAITDSS